MKQIIQKQVVYVVTEGVGKSVTVLYHDTYVYVVLLLY